MGVSRLTWVGLAALLAMAATGALATGDAAPIAARAGCDPGGLVVQTMTGRVSACVRLGNIAPGRHTVGLRQLEGFVAPRVVKRPLPPTPKPLEPAITVTLSPSSGGPGTVVTVTGHLQRALRLPDSHPNACWDGCQDGLPYGDVALRWVSPRTFRTRIVIPAAPWIENARGRVVPLRTGAYPIGIDCLRVARGCEAVTEGTAAFHLRVARPVAWCRAQGSCVRLRVTPGRAAPGDVVRVSGLAPLVEGNMTATGAGYGTVVLGGARRGPAIRFGAESVTVGRGAIDVTAPPRYEAQPPLAQVSDGLSQIAADPADPSAVAWCAGQTIAVSGPAGTTPIPSASARPVLQAMGFSFRHDPEITCAAVAPVTTSTGSPAGLAAAFSVTVAAGAPPFYLAALVTHDDGQTWAPIPVPHGSGPAGFGGFRYAGPTLEAVYARSFKALPRAYPGFDATRPLAELASGDGQGWTAAPLGCPPAGPCVTFGPYLPGNCAMNGTMQTLLRSTDGGRRWSPLDFPAPVQDCGEAELVATSKTSELLVDSTSTYPVLRTTDGGVTWHDIELPRRPGLGGMTVLPDGSLVMAQGLGYAGRWKLLRHGARRWCTVRVPSARVQRRSQIAPMTVIAGALWWLTGPPGNPTAAPVVNRLPISELRC